MNRNFAILSIFILLIYMTGAFLSAQAIANEYKIKSAYIYKICKFTRWKDTENRDAPFTIFVIGKLNNDSKLIFPPKLKLKKKKIVVKEINSIDKINGADALFIAGSERERLQEILKKVKNRNILTISDSEGFAEKGVIINLFIKNESVGFEINSKAAKESKVELHSQLYKIGKVINR